MSGKKNSCSTCCKPHCSYQMVEKGLRCYLESTVARTKYQASDNHLGIFLACSTLASFWALLWECPRRSWVWSEWEGIRGRKRGSSSFFSGHPHVLCKPQPQGVRWKAIPSYFLSMLFYSRQGQDQLRYLGPKFKEVLTHFQGCAFAQWCLILKRNIKGCLK